MIGRLIDGRYQVRSRIARGGMATVYLATDLRLERRVAVKVMHGHLADDAQFTQRFIQEARSAARLAHPNVVNVFDQGQDGDSVYLVMEFLPGITLRELLQEYGSLTSEQTVDIAEAVLGGLASAHRAGIVHRDLKPENVLLADDGRIKIGDFGLARAASANTATGAALLGTIAYLSPELVTRGIADTRSDIYAVGIMMFEMLTGEQPFVGEQPMQIAYQHAHETVPPPSGRNPRVPAALDELVLWATSRNPDDRPRDATQLLDELRQVDGELRTAGGSTATAAQRTVVLPAAAPPTAATTAFAAPRPDPAAAASEAATQIIGGRTPRATPEGSGAATPSAARLATTERTRRRRRWWVLALVLVLIAGAGTTGWWFAAGPGARTTVPESVLGLSPDDAAAALTELGFAVDVGAAGQVYSTEVPAGAVAATDPAAGQPVEKGAAVRLLVSQGPEPLELPDLAGETEETAVALVQEHWTLGDTLRQFSSKTDIGIVMTALNADGDSLDDEKRYGELLPITLVVSAGKVPSVKGMSIDEATSTLGQVGLTARTGPEDYDDEVEAGRVIGVVTKDSNGDNLVIRQGDEVALRISRGPEPVEIPEVEDTPWISAQAALLDAGFVIELADFGSRAIDSSADLRELAEVDSIDPAPGDTADKGSTVTVTLRVN